MPIVFTFAFFLISATPQWSWAQDIDSGEFSDVDSDDLESKHCTDCDLPEVNDIDRDLIAIPEEVLDWHNKKNENKTVSIVESGCAIGSPYGMRKHPILKRRIMHTGQDVKSGGRALPLRSPMKGVVVFRGRRGGYGNQVRIKLSNGYTVSYSHMKAPGKYKSGETVNAGTVVGNIGSTGRSTGPHLHLEVFDPKGRRVNPLSAFKRNEICGAS